MNAAKAFRDLVVKRSAKHGARELTNVTFFMGAGFSKTWDETSPTGYDLFTFPKEFMASIASAVEIDELLTQPGYPTIEDTAPTKFKELLYNLNMQLKYPGIRTRYMDDNSIQYVVDEIKAVVQKRFESLSSLNYFDEALGCFPVLNPTESQKAILRFFQWLSEQQAEDGGAPHGVHVDFLSTNYDYVIETILDNTGEKHGLRNSYRGVTPRLVNGKRNSNVVHDAWSVTSLFKINGGFEIIPDNIGTSTSNWSNLSQYEFDYRKRSFDDLRLNAPEIMMPSREQDYSNAYFTSIFPKAVRLLQESEVLVLVGYSLSEEDALLRFMIHQFAEDLRDVHGKYIFYVDYAEDAVLNDRLQGCFRYMNRMDDNNVFTHSGGFISWIEEVLAAG